MHLFVNTYITDGSVPPGAGVSPMRGLDKLEVLKYQLGSYSRVPWDDVRLYIELGPEYSHRQRELDELVSRVFPSCSVYTGDRNTDISAWRKRLDYLRDLPPKTAVWLSCNHDHPLIARDLNLLYKIDSMFAETESDYKVCQYSHWYEYLHWTVKYGYRHELPGFVSTQINTHWTQATHIISAALLLKWFFENNPPADVYLPRPDWTLDRRVPLIQNNQPHRTYVPLEEFCRHFEGYYHDGTPYSEIPPLKVPEDYGINSGLIQTPEEEHRVRTTNFRRYNTPCPEEFITWKPY